MRRLAYALSLLSGAAALSACPFVMEDAYEVRDDSTALPDAQPPPPPACGQSTATPGPCPPGCECPDAITCVLRCEGKDSCKDDTLQCPLGRNCHVLCSGEAACEAAEVRCKGGAACDIDCSGGACKDLEAKCASGPCSLNCAEYGCEKARVECGTNACHAVCGSAKKPQLVCGPSCGCAQC